MNPSTTETDQEHRPATVTAAPLPSRYRPRPLSALRRRAAARPAVLVLLLAVAVGACAVIGSQRVFPYLTDDHDEGIYLLQAHALADGQLFPRAPKHPDAFVPWLSLVSEGRYVVKYTPVHAAILAVGVRLGDVRWSLGLVASGVVVLTYALAREVLGSRRLALLAAVFMALSPLFLLQSTTFLSYTSSLLLLEGFALALLVGMRTNRRLLLSASGLIFGLAVFARPYDALVFSLPFGGYFLASRWRRRAELARGAAWFAAGAALPLVAMLAYFEAATGSPFRSPFNLLEPRDTLGFGVRKLLPNLPELAFTPSKGWYGVSRYVLLTSFWGFGGLLLIGFFLSSVIRLRMSGPQPWVALVAVTFMTGYLFFWGAYATSFRGGLTALLGPFYFLPVLVPLTLLAAKGFADLWSTDRLLARVAFASMVVVSGYLLVKAVNVNLRLTNDDRRMYTPVANARLGRSVVFVPPVYGPQLLHPFAWLHNAPDYDGERVYALDRGDTANLDLLEDYPGRSAYRMVLHGRYRANPSDPGLTTSLEPLSVVKQPSIGAVLSLRSSTRDPYVALTVTAGGWKEWFVLDTDSRPGRRYRADITIGPDAVRVDGPVEGRVSQTVDEDGFLSISVETSSDGQSWHTRYQRRLGYGIEAGALEVLLPGTVPVNELRADPLVIDTGGPATTAERAGGA